MYKDGRFRWYYSIIIGSCKNNNNYNLLKLIWFCFQQLTTTTTADSLISRVSWWDTANATNLHPDNNNQLTELVLVTGSARRAARSTVLKNRRWMRERLTRGNRHFSLTLSSLLLEREQWKRQIYWIIWW